MLLSLREDVSLEDIYPLSNSVPPVTAVALDQSYLRSPDSAESKNVNGFDTLNLANASKFKPVTSTVGSPVNVAFTLPSITHGSVP